MSRIEQREPMKRLACVWHPSPRSQHLVGIYSTARVVVGDPAYQWSDGEIVRL